MSKAEATRLADALENGTYLLSVERGATAALLRRWPDGEPVAWLVEGWHDGKLIAHIVHLTLDEAKASAAVFSRHYTTTKTVPLYTAPPANRIGELEAENNHLRASVANSGGPCAYCKLPREEWSQCVSGFPGCARGDDAMLCPHVGAELESADRIAALEAVIEQARVAMRALLNVDVHSSLTEDDVISIDAKMRDALRAIEEVRK